MKKIIGKMVTYNGPEGWVKKGQRGIALDIQPFGYVNVKWFDRTKDITTVLKRFLKFERV